MRLWHRWVLRHSVRVSPVTRGLFDSSRGEMHYCECGKAWAL
jgi:hypothetical protein